MTTLTVIALGLIGLFAVAAWLAIWSRRDTSGRSCAMALFLIAIPAIAAAAVEALGHHRPLALTWNLRPGDHVILAAKMVQDKAIYLYLDDAERIEPRPLVLPWSNDTATAIQLAIDGAPDGHGGQAILSYRSDGEESEMAFHPIPQLPAPPEKSAPAPGVTFGHPAA